MANSLIGTELEFIIRNKNSLNEILIDYDDMEKELG